MVGPMGLVGLIVGLAIVGLGLGMLRFRRVRAANSRAFWEGVFPRWHQPDGRAYFVYRYVLGPIFMIAVGAIFVVGGIVSLTR